MTKACPFHLLSSFPSTQLSLHAQPCPLTVGSKGFHHSFQSPTLGAGVVCLHTAQGGVRVTAATLKEFEEEALEAIFSVMVSIFFFKFGSQLYLMQWPLRPTTCAAVCG